MIKTTFFAAALGLAALVQPATAGNLFGWTGEIPGIDNCRSGTNYAHCASGQNHSNPAVAQTNARVPGKSNYGPTPVVDPGDGCGGEVSQGSVSLGGGKVGQGTVGGNTNTVGGSGK